MRCSDLPKGSIEQASKGITNTVGELLRGEGQASREGDDCEKRGDEDDGG